MKMGKEILAFSDVEIGENKFNGHKSPLLLKNVDIEKVLVSKKISSGEKYCNYFTGCIIIKKLNHYI